MHKTCTGIKKTQKTKVWASTQGWGSIDCKIVVILFFWCLRRFCEDHALFFFSCFDACACLVKVRVTKPAQASTKTKKTKPLDAQNLHRHQKNPKNQSLSIYSGLGVYRLQNCGYFVFLMPAQVLWRSCFVFFVFLMPVHVWWRLESQNLHRHQKNQKNQTTRCTKPAQASIKPKKKQSLSIYSGLGVYRLQNLGYFVFFDACAGFVKIMLCFFCFFDACACFVKVCRD